MCPLRLKTMKKIRCPYFELNDLERACRDKAELRREMKARRRGLAADEKAAADAVVCEKLKTRGDIGEMVDPFDSGTPLAVYLASPDEINIDPYIEYMLHAGVEVVAPRWNGETYELAKLKGLDEKNLRRGPMGIREPIDADVVEPKSVYAWINPRRRAQSKSASPIRSRLSMTFQVNRTTSSLPTLLTVLLKTMRLNSRRRTMVFWQRSR